VVEIGRRIEGVAALLLGLQVPDIKGHRSPLLCQLYAGEVSFTNRRVIYAALLSNGALHVPVRGYHSEY
jgi:hypothetical protein